MKEEVKILSGDFASDLEKQINDHLSKGWHLRGSMQTILVNDGFNGYSYPIQMMYHAAKEKIDYDLEDNINLPSI